jgi:catechol 2,3-dioxygenase-like lactoylglutathione lyase family enzyme
VTSQAVVAQAIRLAHASFGTRDLNRAIRFYQDVLGGEIAHEFRNGAGELYGAFLHMGEGTFIELFRDANVQSGGSSAFRHVCYEVTDLAAMASHLRQLGLDPAIRRGRTDGILQFFIEDADGNTIEFQQQDEQSALHRFLADKQSGTR